MKKNLILSIILAVMITGCSQADIVGIPKGYIDKQEYYEEGGFQHYVDYAKYIYPSKDIILNNSEYDKITKDDIDSITEYFDDFYNSMKSLNRLNEYDFSNSIINEGDYIKVETKEGENIGDSNSKYEKFDDYSIYFFDIETLTLYYISND